MTLKEQTVGERLKELRLEAGMGQKELVAALKAENVDIELNEYKKWENKETLPSYWKLRDLAYHFGSTLDYLFGDSDNRYKEKEIIDIKKLHKIINSLFKD